MLKTWEDWRPRKCPRSLWRLSPRHQGWGLSQGAAPQPPSSFFGNTILLSNQSCQSQNYNPPASAPFHVSVIASCTVFLSEMDQRNQPWLIWKTEERTCYTSYHVGSPDNVVFLILAHLHPCDWFSFILQPEKHGFPESRPLVSKAILGLTQPSLGCCGYQPWSRRPVAKMLPTYSPCSRELLSNSVFYQ